MRKTTAVLSALALSALALTGCSAEPRFDGAPCDRDSSAALEMSVAVDGEFGTPSARVSTPVRSADVSYADVIVGDGPAIASSEQSAIMTRMLLNGTTGMQLGGAVNLWSPDTAAAELPGVEKALKCATEGSRIIVSVPAANLPAGVAEQVGLDQKDSLVAVYDVQYTLLPKAEGHDVFNDARGLPTVVRAPDGRPGIIIPDSAAPKKTVQQTLIVGDGERVGDGRAMFHFTAVDWSNRSVTGSSWDSGVVLDVNAVPEEVMKAISKATVGSQLLVVVPGEDSDATAYVVDVLGIVPAELIAG